MNSSTGATKMNNEKMRGEFKVWARDSGQWDGAEDPFDWISYIKSDGEYYSPSLELAWQAWQASRESLVIELPQRWNDSHGRWQESETGHIVYTDEIIAVIHATGVKTK
jgi:hypothetical protein